MLEMRLYLFAVLKSRMTSQGYFVARLNSGHYLNELWILYPGADATHMNNPGGIEYINLGCFACAIDRAERNRDSIR